MRDIDKLKRMLAMRNRRDDDTADGRQQDVELLIQVSSMIEPGGGSLADQLEQTVPVVDLTHLPWAFEWSVVPGPDMLQ